MKKDNNKNRKSNNLVGKAEHKNIKHDPVAESARTKFGLNPLDNSNENKR